MILKTLPLLLALGCRDKAVAPGDSVVDDTDPPKDTADDTAPPAEDLDGDGFDTPTDCDDANTDIHPDAAEVCDGIDNDCDGLTDDDDDNLSAAPVWHTDADGDGYGDAAAAVQACLAPDGAVEEAGDCNDNDPAYHPGAAEADCTDPNDYNCDGSVGYADADGDGFAACADCDETTTDANPGAEEVCDEIDNDCDGLVDDEDDPVSGQNTWYMDVDGDEYGGEEVLGCDRPLGSVAVGGDCDDLDPTLNPGAPEDDCTDPTDYNCDGSTGHADNDADGFAACEDCNDDDPATNPSGLESCDGVDNDCDDLTDEDDAFDVTAWYADTDGDGFGDADDSVLTCDQPEGYVADSSDCDDGDDDISPEAAERCDDVDNDCDTVVDEDASVDASTWYTDEDGDRFGDASSDTIACDNPVGAVSDASDCDDTEETTYPGAPETCDGVDNDCDDTVDEPPTDALAWYADEDGDGYGDPLAMLTTCDATTAAVTDASDCDDTQAETFPGAPETCDDRDNDCDGEVDEDAPDASTWYDDDDGDGFGDATAPTISCAALGSVSDATDCDDSTAAANPDAPETCDGIDNDCDTTVDEPDAVDANTWYADVDADSFGDPTTGITTCDPAGGTVTDGSDCNDTLPEANPSAPEMCDGMDNDCDDLIDESDATDATTWYDDADGDSYGDPTSAIRTCYAPSGTVNVASDCDDDDPSAYPGAPETCDGADNDCDTSIDEDDTSVWYADTDGDGYGDDGTGVVDCAQPEGYVLDAADCDDGDAGVNPGATEVCNDLDDNCDTVIDADATDALPWYTDADEDGYGDLTTAVITCDAPDGAVPDGTDCDDSTARIHPGAVEVCSGQELDCDGAAPASCESCSEVLSVGSSTGDGLYDIDPTGTGADVEVWCDMTTDGGGWTMVQRTVWDWTDTSRLKTGYATWYGSTLGDPDDGTAFRLAGQYWDDLNGDLEHMLLHVARDSSTGGDCDPLYYLGTNGTFSISSTAASLSTITSTATFTNSTSLSATDTGTYSTCVTSYDGVPWFYGLCCSTCPTFKGGYWSDTAHPMASYLDTTADAFGSTSADVCPSGGAVTSYYFEGINVMEYYVR